MYNFLVPPEYCLILKALSDTPSLREAAKILEIDPGALARKIQKMSGDYGLAYKVDNRWVATQEGKKLVQWVDESIAIQKSILGLKPNYRISSYTWLAEQLLIPHFRDLNVQTQNSCHWSYQLVTGSLEDEVINSRTDYVIACQPPYDPGIASKRIAPDPWCIVIPPEWRNDFSNLDEASCFALLQTKPFVRVNGVDPEDLLDFIPSQIAELHVDGIIGVRSAVASGLGWSCLPQLALYSDLRAGKSVRLPFPLKKRNDITLWWSRSRKDLAAQVSEVKAWLESSIITCGNTNIQH